MLASWQLRDGLRGRASQVPELAGNTAKQWSFLVARCTRVPATDIVSSNTSASISEAKAGGRPRAQQAKEQSQKESTASTSIRVSADSETVIKKEDEPGNCVEDRHSPRTGSESGLFPSLEITRSVSQRGGLFVSSCGVPNTTPYRGQVWSRSNKPRVRVDQCLVSLKTTVMPVGSGSCGLKLVSVASL